MSVFACSQHSLHVKASQRFSVHDRIVATRLAKLQICTRTRPVLQQHGRLVQHAIHQVGKAMALALIGSVIVHSRHHDQVNVTHAILVAPNRSIKRILPLKKRHVCISSHDHGTNDSVLKRLNPLKRPRQHARDRRHQFNLLAARATRHALRGCR
jgi:hypothetical protein